MSILINFKICDNVAECGGIEMCSQKALYWDTKKKTIVVNNKRCTSCGKCVGACPVEAIRLVKNDEEYQKIKQEIKKDPRKISDLFVDRYGAQPIHPGFLVQEKNFDLKKLQSAHVLGVEFFNNNSIECLLKSIPLKELLEDAEINFKKVELKSKTLLKKYQIKKLPALVFFKEGKMTGKIEGFYSINEKKELKNKIRKILS